MKIMIRKELISASLLLSFLCLCVCLCPHRGMRGPAALCGPTLFFLCGVEGGAKEEWPAKEE